MNDASESRDPDAELSALRSGCGLVEQRWVETVEVSGADRLRFLNGYLTCDVGTLEPGQGAYGFFTSTQGRILSDAVVTADEEALRVDVPRGRGDALIEHLSRYILADRVELRRDEAAARWLLVGPDVAAVVGEPPGELWTTVERSIRDVEVALRRERPLGVPVVSLRASAARATAVAEACVAAGGRPVGLDGFEVLRLEAGLPRYGADFGEAHFPQETGLEDAVSYTKGCYLGQEVVARIHYRGRVNHELRGLRLDGRVPAELGAVTWQGEEVGVLGSMAYSPDLDATLGLVILHRKAMEVGTLVTLARGSEASVELPGFAAAELKARRSGVVD